MRVIAMRVIAMRVIAMRVIAMRVIAMRVIEIHARDRFAVWSTSANLRRSSWGGAAPASRGRLAVGNLLRGRHYKKG